ncbi:MAG: hypothetical protein ACUVUG_00695 [Candidatus Aminicenantia bacterium]
MASVRISQKDEGIDEYILFKNIPEDKVLELFPEQAFIGSMVITPYEGFPRFMIDTSEKSTSDFFTALLIAL